MQHDERHVRFGNNDIYRAQTIDDHERLYNGPDSHEDDAARRRSSSDPSGRGRQQRPKLAVIRPRRDGAGTALAQVPENTRLASTAVFNAPGRGHNEVNQELADVLDVIGVSLPRPRIQRLQPITDRRRVAFQILKSPR